MEAATDRLGRKLRDLRISVTDRCNFRCGYCMPEEVYGPGYRFLEREELLDFEEIVRVARVAAELGVRKLRLTGGEPLMRRGIEDLVSLLAAIDGVEDLAMTTNGVLLAVHAEALRRGGLRRVTVSLDALDPEIFAKMNGVGAKVERVLRGIEAAQEAGLPVKVNSVIQRGVNEGEVLPLARWAKSTGVEWRMIEYMDVGETNGWKREEVVPGREVLERLRGEFDLRPAEFSPRGEVAVPWVDAEGWRVGFIQSVTQPFCRDCQRLRLSADGKVFTCLFASEGHDLRPLLRGGGSDPWLRALLGGVWGERRDRYSEERGTVMRSKAEMGYLGG